MHIVTVCALLMLVCFFFEVPIYLSMLASSVLYFVVRDANILMIPQRMVAALESVPILAVPFFIMSGVCMNYTGITKRMIKFAETLTGHMNGGLAQVNVVLSTLMGGLSGSNLADAAMESKILVPQMTKRGYAKGFSAAITAMSALITPIIPPGITMITFSYVANLSVGRVFMAGIGPGVLMCIMLMVMVSIVSKKRGYKPLRAKRASGREVLNGAKTAFLALLLPLVIIGGIRLGVFTATEAGAIAVVYSLVLGVFVYREMKFKHLKMALRETVVSTVGTMLIFAAANCFAYFVSNERIPEMIKDFLLQYISTPLQFMLLVNVFLLIAGMFMEGGALLILLVPLLMPMVYELGIDPVHFAIVFILNISIGCVTPPVGTVMYITCQNCDTEISDFVKDGMPFYLALIICLVILSLVPQITLFLPNLVFG